MYDLISTSLNDLLLCAMELPLPEELPLPVSEEPLPPVPVQKSRRSGKVKMPNFAFNEEHKSATMKFYFSF